MTLPCSVHPAAAASDAFHVVGIVVRGGGLLDSLVSIGYGAMAVLSFIIRLFVRILLQLLLLLLLLGSEIGIDDSDLVNKCVFIVHRRLLILDFRPVKDHLRLVGR